MKFLKYIRAICFLLFCTVVYINAEVLDHSWEKLIRSRNAEWYLTDSAKIIAENVMLYQRNIGGWPKNTLMHHYLSSEQKEKLLQKKDHNYDCTTDNGATILEMTYLSNMYRMVPDEKYKNAFLKGLSYLLEAQYENGGWPQFYPLHKDYSREITFNDNSMINIMELLRHLSLNDGKYSITPDSSQLEKIKSALNKGIDCILKTQYIQNGILTAWCAQYDEVTLLPAKARAYELPSLSGQESANIILYLMEIENPSDEIIKAVDAAVEWFENTKITGLRVEHYKTSDGLREKRLISDPDAPSLWARFMELDNNKPFFCDRDGIKRDSLFDIGQERRGGYRWYSPEPQLVLNIYPEWKKKWGK